MDLEVGHGETEVYPRVQVEAVRLIKNRGVSYVQTSQDLSAHTPQLRDCGEEVLRWTRYYTRE